MSGTLSTVLESDATETAVLRGGSSADFFGLNTFSLDINNDGTSDTILSNESGNEFYLIFGDANDLNVSYELTSLDAGRYFSFTNTGSTGTGFGTFEMQDVDQDGRLDLLIGASGDDTTATDAGAVYTLYGADTQTWDTRIEDAVTNNRTNVDVSGFATGEMYQHWGGGIFGDQAGDRLTVTGAVGPTHADYGHYLGAAYEDGSDDAARAEFFAGSYGITTQRQSDTNTFYVIGGQQTADEDNRTVSDVPSEDMFALTGITGLATTIKHFSLDIYDPLNGSAYLPDPDAPYGFQHNPNFGDVGGTLFVSTRDANGAGENSADQEGTFFAFDGDHIVRGGSVDVGDLTAGQVLYFEGERFAVDNVEYGLTNIEVGSFAPNEMSFVFSVSPSFSGQNGTVQIIDLPNIVQVVGGDQQLTTNLDTLTEGVWTVTPSDLEGPNGGLGQSMQTLDVFGDRENAVQTYYGYSDFLLRDAFFELISGKALLALLTNSLGLNSYFYRALAFSAREDNIPGTQGGNGNGLLQPAESVDPDPVGVVSTTLNGYGSIEVYRNFNQTENPATNLTEDDFDTTNGYQIFGAVPFGGTGWDMATGDANGDGVEDLIIGVPFEGSHFSSTGGAVHTVMGGEKRLRAQDDADGEVDSIIQLSAISNMAALRAGLTITDDPDTDVFGFGADVIGLGDINGDGIDDFAISSPFASAGGLEEAGRVVVFYGKLNFGGADFSMENFTAADGFVIEGVTFNAQLGQGIFGGQDINNDGINDILIGQGFDGDPITTVPAPVYGLYGRNENFGATVDLANLAQNEGFILRGDGVNVQTFLPKMIGDINNDGIQDFVVSHWYDNQFSVIFGEDGLFPSVNEIADLDGTNGFVVRGDFADTFSSGNFRGGEDLNGDGIDDMVVTWYAPVGRFDNEVDIFFGSADPFAAVVDLSVTPEAAQRITLDTIESPYAALGAAQDVGDFDGDGFTDLLLGGTGGQDGPGATSVIEGGNAILIYGSDAGFPTEITTETLANVRSTVFTQPLDFHRLGIEVDLGGDVDGDGAGDMLLTAVGPSDAAVYLVFGGNGTLPSEVNLTELDGEFGFKFTTAQLTDQFGFAADILGDIDGDGHADFAIQAPGSNDDLQGSVHIVFGGHANLMALDFADGTQDGTIEIENLGIAYQEVHGGLQGNGSFEGSFRDEAVGVGSVDYDGDEIDVEANMIEMRGGDDFASGGGGNDTIDGGAGADILLGDAGNDILLGGAGMDTMHGGTGDDTMTGGDGADHFIIEADGGLTVITDYELGVDTLDLTLMTRVEAFSALDAAVAGSALLTFDDGSQVRVEGDGVTPDSLAADAGILLAANAAPTGAPELVGTPREDQFLSVDLANFADPDGADPTDFNYQWLRDGIAIDGQTIGGYRLTQDDVGSIISVEASIVDAGGTREVFLLEADAPVENVDDRNINNIFVTGDAIVGGTVMVDISTISDEDGLNFDSFVYSWQLFPSGDTIPGETGQSLVITPDLEGEQVRAFVIWEDNFGNVDFLGSFVSEVIAPPLNADPEGIPLIIGETIAEDEILGVDLSPVTDADGIDVSTIQYQWLRGISEIIGATDSTYQLTQSDVNSTIRVVVTYTDDGGTTEMVQSAITAPVENVNDHSPGIPVSGDFFVGGTVTADRSFLMDEDGIDESTVLFRWVRRDPETLAAIDGFYIPGATGETYVVTEADQGVRLGISVSYTDDFGRFSVTGSFGEYVNVNVSGPVSFDGQAEAGETLTANLSGLMDPDGIPLDMITYQWRLDGVDVDGAAGTADSFALTLADVGKEISLAISFVDDLGFSENLVSEALAVTVAGQLVEGNDLPNDLTGDGGADTIMGAGDNDTLTGLGGDDTLDGGDGIDTGVFGGPQGAYTLTLSPSAVTLEDRREDGTGTDSLSGIEFLDFDTGTFNLDIFDGPTGLSAEEFGAIVELYIAYFNRAPDALGLYYWGTEFSNGFSLPEMALSFFGQPETQATYAAVLDEMGKLDIADQAKVDAFVTEVYANVLGRTPDVPGFDYWTDQLVNNSQFITPDIFILSIIGGAKNPSNPTPQTDLDQAYLATKADLGAYFAVIKGMSDLDDAAASLALFDGTPDSVTATVAAIDGHFADALDADTGDFLMPLVGVIDDPFGMMG